MYDCLQVFPSQYILLGLQPVVWTEEECRNHCTTITTWEQVNAGKRAAPQRDVPFWYHLCRGMDHCQTTTFITSGWSTF